LCGARDVGVRRATSLDSPYVLVKRSVYVNVGETEQHGNAKALQNTPINDTVRKWQQRLLGVCSDVLGYPYPAGHCGVDVHGIMLDIDLNVEKKNSNLCTISLTSLRLVDYFYVIQRM